jgi:plasmid stability protein
MKSLHIRDIPIDTLSALKRLAKNHHRSLQGELHAILEVAARTAPPSEPKPLEWITVKTGVSEPTWSRDEIYGTDGR